MRQFLHIRNCYGYFLPHLASWHSGSYVLYCVLDYLVDYVNYHVIVNSGDVSFGRGRGRLIGRYFFYQKPKGYGFLASPALV